MQQNQITVDEWVDLFREIGLNDDAMRLWHRKFEARHPEAHQSFLEWLGIDAARIVQIRAAHR